MDEFIIEISERFDALDNSEKDIIRGMIGTPEYRVLSKVFGPDFMREVVLDEPVNITAPRRGLGTR